MRKADSILRLSIDMPFASRSTRPQTNGHASDVSRRHADSRIDNDSNDTSESFQALSDDGNLSTKLRNMSINKRFSQSGPTTSNALGHSSTVSHDGFWSNPVPFRNSSMSIDDSKSSLSHNSSISRPDAAYVSPDQKSRKGTIGSIMQHAVPASVARRFTKESLFGRGRRNTVWSMYNKAQERGAKLQRKRWAQILFQGSFYVLLISFVYFVLVGRPLWKGTVWWLYWVMKNKLVFQGGFWITIGMAFL